MTEAEILAMPATRELDALVACRLMGWDDTAEDWQLAKSMVPRYSGDVAAAWQVFLIIQGRLFSVRNRFYAALAGQARLPDGQMPSGLWVLGVLRDRFPEAVCKAALIAVSSACRS